MDDCGKWQKYWCSRSKGNSLYETERTKISHKWGGYSIADLDHSRIGRISVTNSFEQHCQSWPCWSLTWLLVSLEYYWPEKTWWNHMKSWNHPKIDHFSIYLYIYTVYIYNIISYNIIVLKLLILGTILRNPQVAHIGGPPWAKGSRAQKKHLNMATWQRHTLCCCVFTYVLVVYCRFTMIDMCFLRRNGGLRFSLRQRQMRCWNVGASCGIKMLTMYMCVTKYYGV